MMWVQLRGEDAFGVGVGLGGLEHVAVWTTGEQDRTQTICCVRFSSPFGEATLTPT